MRARALLHQLADAQAVEALRTSREARVFLFLLGVPEERNVMKKEDQRGAKTVRARRLPDEMEDHAEVCSGVTARSAFPLAVKLFLHRRQDPAAVLLAEAQSEAPAHVQERLSKTVYPPTGVLAEEAYQQAVVTAAAVAEEAGALRQIHPCPHLHPP
ncbi:MAG: hypothetical protein G01um1014106_322, partial [Parcubacteria group bacterium Gr01-1014_106]